MSTHQYRLGKLAKQGSLLHQRGAINAVMRTFYASNCNAFAATGSGNANGGGGGGGGGNGTGKLLMVATNPMLQARKQKMPLLRTPSKLIGVKKTLINQLQGMSHAAMDADSRNSSVRESAKYKIFGKTELFSSTGSLSKRNFESLLESKRRIHTKALSTVLQSREYHNQDTRNAKMIKEISRSIQEDLMPINATTKNLISYPSLREPTQSRQTAARFTSDPLDGWKHPNRIKNLSDNIKTNNAAGGLAAQSNHYLQVKENLFERFTSRNLQKTGLSEKRFENRHPQNKLADKYASTAMERPSNHHWDQRASHSSSSNSQSTTANPKSNKLHVDTKSEASGSMTTQRHSHSLSKPIEDSISSKQPQPHPQPIVDPYSYAQPKEERELLQNSILKEAESDVERRLNTKHYDANKLPQILSASQRVINQQLDSVHKYYGGDKKRKPMQVKLMKQFIRSVNPMPVLIKSRSNARAQLVPPNDGMETQRAELQQRLPTPIFDETEMELLEEKRRLPSMTMRITAKQVQAKFVSPMEGVNSQKAKPNFFNAQQAKSASMSTYDLNRQSSDFQLGHTKIPLMPPIPMLNQQSDPPLQPQRKLHVQPERETLDDHSMEKQGFFYDKKSPLERVVTPSDSRSSRALHLQRLKYDY